MLKLIIGIKENIDSKNVEISGVLIRSMVEVVANMSYIFYSPKSEELAERYISTSKSTAKLLYSNKSEFSGGVNWAKYSISKRVSLFSRRTTNDYYFINLWLYLSTFAHYDAGFIGTYNYDQREKLRLAFIGYVTMLMLCAMDILREAKILTEKHDILFEEEYERHKKERALGNSKL